MIDSWGCELEFGDVNRNLTLPKELGSWNYFETDIVNQREPYWGIAADPKGIDPPFGGEINTIPTETWQEQVEIIERLNQFFITNGCEPTVSCVSNTHIHAKVAHKHLDKLIKYTKRNQKFFVDFVYDKPLVPKTSVSYLHYDSGRLIEEQKFELMQQYGNCFELFGAGNINEGVLTNRYAINLQSLVYNGTIEFRCFRATLDKEQLANCFRICELFVLCAIKNGPDLKDISAIRSLQFPKLNYDDDLFKSWQKTRKPKTIERKRS
jgi:hypothetical protein